MARFFRRAAASLGIGLVVFAFAAPARSVENETFGLSPFPERINNVVRRTFAVPLDPRATFEDAVRVYNRTDQPVELLVYAADARAALDGTISIGLRGAAPTGVASWVHLSRSSVNLPPRGGAVVRFRITVGSKHPSPDLGAIVADNAAPARPGLARRLDLLIRTTPPGSPTLSTKVRAFSLRSGWTIVAIGVLVAAGVLVWLARRRARRDDGEVAPARTKTDDDTPDASRPVLHRFGRTDTDPKLSAIDEPPETEAPRRRTSRRRPVERDDDRPLLDEVAFVDEDGFESDETDEVELPPRSPKPARKPQPKRPSAPKRPPPGDKLDYIPLDDL